MFILYVANERGETNQISVAFPVDSELCSESSNPIQNKAVYAKLTEKADTAELSGYYTIVSADLKFLDKNDPDIILSCGGAS